MKSTSQNGPQSASPEEIVAWVEKHYAHVMTPWQLDLLKGMMEHPGEQIVLTPRKSGRSSLHRVVKEAIAVLNSRSEA